MIYLSLPYPPSVNQLWRMGKGKMYLSEKYRVWKKQAMWEASLQKPNQIKGKYRFYIQAVRPDKRRRDIDNLIKVASDLCVTIGIIEDDHLCEEVNAKWVKDGDPFVIKIEPAEG